MRLGDYVLEKDKSYRKGTFSEWISDKPEVANEIIQGYNAGKSAMLIRNWLREAHDCPFSMNPVHNWLRDNAVA